MDQHREVAGWKVGAVIALVITGAMTLFMLTLPWMELAATRFGTMYERYYQWVIQ